MQILSLELNKFIPLSHGSITYIKIETKAILTLILGCNGKGKSSILRELNPWPATRTDYAVGGFKKIEISHQNDMYLLISDFSSRDKAHSFLKNNVELNLSGNTDVQEDLCRQHFGITDVIEKLTSGKYKLCTMGKMDRRSLFMSTYPSDLTFILNKHKNVCSQIRTFKDNLKALKERQADLSNKLIEKDQLTRSYELKQLLDQANSCLDQEIFLIKNTQQEYLNDPAYNPQRVSSIDELIDLRQELSLIYNKFIVFYQHYPHAFSEESLATVNKLIQANNDGINHQLQSVNEQGKTLTEEINQFKQIMNNDIESEIKHLKHLIKNYQTQLAEISVDLNIPILSTEELERIRDKIAPRLLSDMEIIQSLPGQLWTIEAIEKGQAWFQKHDLIRSKYEYELSIANSELNRLQRQREHVLKTSYPASCNLTCALKTNIDQQLNEIKTEATKWLDVQVKLISKLTSIKRRLGKLEMALQSPTTALPIIRKLEQLISGNNWGNFLINHAPLISFLNHNCSDLGNNLTRLIQNSTNLHLQKQYTTELSLCQTKVTALEATNLPAKTLIEKSIIDKEIVLNRLIGQQRQLTDQLQLNSNRYVLNTEILELIDIFNVKAIETEATCKQLSIQYQLMYLQVLLDEKSSYKLQINTKLREIEHTIKEQEGYLIRLNEEVLPSILVVENKLQLWTVIEKELSPSAGLPHIYAIRYINSLIKLVNDYIRLVWSYDMEILYISEERHLDFSLEVMLNKNTELKDISICSDGQKAIIDLAFTLAICTLRGYAFQFPLKLDEIDAALSESHRTKLMSLFGKIISEQAVNQMFMVNHFASLYSGILDADIVCLSEEGIVLPQVYNTNTIIR